MLLVFRQQLFIKIRRIIRVSIEVLFPATIIQWLKMKVDKQLSYFELKVCHAQY